MTHPPPLDGDRQACAGTVQLPASQDSAAQARLQFLDDLGRATRALTDPQELMSVTARQLCEYLGTTRCAYADVDADSNRFTIRSDWARPGVASSAGVYSLDLFGTQATSNLRQGRHLVVNDVDAELGEDDGARMFNAIGIKAIICAGLVKAGRLVAMMAVHHAQPRRWSGDEIALVEEVVDRCWAHIERVRDHAALLEQDRRKDEFLATLAHELRNPLAPMQYAVAMMRMPAQGGAHEKAREVIARQVATMSRLIDDLLDLSRINRGLIELRKEEVRLATVMARAVEAAQPAMEAARHRLDVALPGEGVHVRADPVRLMQVIGNLLSNAAKYTPDGGHIRLAAWPAGASVVIEVADNGIGIPPEDQGRIFQMFTQLPHTAQRAQGGLGIGLSLVRTLVEMHGGTVRVTSGGLDEGSRFCVELPLLAAPPAQAPAVFDTAPSAAQRRKVLVVEDLADSRESLMMVLDFLGYEVVGAADGQQALDTAERFAPDIVLLDLGLPVIDGIGVAQALRQRPATARIPILALTGWGSDADRARTAAAGIDGHLVKPVDVAVLQQRLAQFQT